MIHDFGEFLCKGIKDFHRRFFLKTIASIPEVTGSVTASIPEQSARGTFGRRSLLVQIWGDGGMAVNASFQGGR